MTSSTGYRAPDAWRKAAGYYDTIVTHPSIRARVQLAEQTQETLANRFFLCMMASIVIGIGVMVGPQIGGLNISKEMLTAYFGITICGGMLISVCYLLGRRSLERWRIDNDKECSIANPISTQGGECEMITNPPFTEGSEKIQFDYYYRVDPCKSYSEVRQGSVRISPSATLQDLEASIIKNENFSNGENFPSGINFDFNGLPKYATVRYVKANFAPEDFQYPQAFRIYKKMPWT